MKALNALVVKEILLILRDRNSLIALFILPALFILIMSLALKDAYNENRALVTYKIANDNNSSTARKLEDFLCQSGLIRSARDDENAQFTIALNDQNISVSVDYRVGNDVLAIFQSQLAFAHTRLKIDLQKEISSAFSLDINESEHIFYAYNGTKTSRPSSVQQSVPSWIVFGMFFIVIPLSNVFVAERRQNTLLRLKSMNVSVVLLLAGKIAPYYFLNQIQTALMLLTGIYVVSIFGGEALLINGSIAALFTISSAVSFSAIATALLIATIAKTAESASTFGGIINVLLGAIGGIMAPKFIMPELMQKFASISPMSWGLDGFLKVFVKGEGVYGVIYESVALVAFGTALIALSAILINKRKD
jgi:ABC-2 type transport system permease protein